jgi:hypothetical protein
VIPKRLRLAPLALLLLAVTSGCSATPKPEPTATPAFASEEEAFAAAEKLYLEYNEAGNAKMAGESTPNPQDFLIGTALEADIDGGRFLAEQGLRISGSAAVTSFVGIEVVGTGRIVTIVAVVCLDATAVHVFDEAGTDVTPADRGDTVAQRVEFVGAKGELWIGSESSESPEEC